MEIDLATLFSDIDLVVFARAGKPVDRTERDPVEVKLEREVEANHYRAQHAEERGAK